MQTPSQRAALTALLVLFLLSLSGCDKDPGYKHTYTTRAIVLSLPGERVTQEFIVHHEAIPEYRSINGSIGMNEMAMPIPVPDQSVLKGISVGDKVELVFGERFEPDHTMGLISIIKLPDDTEMNLGATTSGAKRKTATDTDGFSPIFDGQTLTDWEGDLRYWSVQDNTIVGQFTAENPLKQNTFLIFRGGENKGVLGDFELKFAYRISEGGNSGVQYRSQETPDFGMKGYQADIHHGPRWTGILYDEHGRKVLADRGQSVIVEANEKPVVVEQFGDDAELMQHIDLDGWNEYHIIARGNRLTHKINGKRMSQVLDEDEAERDLQGLLGLQIHRSTPVKVEFKAIRLKVSD
ncbi:MAG: family 16 glycoside hydrolase [Phycisphaeraceae bacterium]